jgi:hypothetical protein
MLLEGLQEEFVVPSIGIAAVVDLVVGGVDFGRGKFLTVLKKRMYKLLHVQRSTFKKYLF